MVLLAYDMQPYSPCRSHNFHVHSSHLWYVVMSSVTVLRLTFVIAACVIAGLIYWLSYLLSHNLAVVMSKPHQLIRFSDSFQSSSEHGREGSGVV